MIKKLLLFPVVILLIAMLHCQMACKSEYSVTIKSKTVKVEIADSEEARSKGLMYRDILDADSGMLFIFPQEDIRHFWMKNTSIPLSIAFIAESGIIVDIKNMRPYSEADVPSAGPAKYALEVNKDWFKNNNIVAGDRAVFSSEIRKKYIVRQ